MPIKKKFNIGTLDGEVLGEPIEATSEEEAYKIAEQMYPGYGDELSVDELEDTEDKLGKMGFEGDEDFGDIDDDYERSYGPVDTKEKYNAYLKWKEDN